MTQLLYFVVHIAVRPRATIDELLQRPRRVHVGLQAWLLMGAMYTTTVFVGWWRGFGASMEPWLPIPAADYYFWETFFVVPVYFVVFASAAGTMQLVSWGLGGTGTCEDTFVVVALGSILPTFLFMWLPETLLVAAVPGMRAQELGGFSFLPPWADAVRQLIVPLWTIGIYAVALGRVQSLSTGRVSIAVVLGMIPAVVVTLVFVR